MDYGKILSRSVNIVWQHKFLILLGILVALGSGSGGGGGGGGGGNGDGQPFGEPGQFPQFQEFAAEIAGLAVGLVTVLVCVGLIVAILIWVVSTVARGGLVAGVDTIESGGQSSFSHAWSAGWHKVWRLLGIGLLPSIPGLILSVVGLVAFVSYGGLFALLGEEFAAPVGMAGLGTIIAVFACFVLPIILVLSILRNFAERACMLEDLGVIDAYRRGASVLMANLGEAIILFVLQIVISIALIVIFFLPGLIAALCCFLWPLLLVVQGAVSAIVSAVWTLAWRTWTGEPAMAR